MDLNQAKDEAIVLVGSAVASLLFDPDWTVAGRSSLTFDDQDRRPGQDGYVDSYDPAWLAAEAVSLLAIRSSGQDRTTRLSVNGDTIEVTPGNLEWMAAELRKRSPLYTLVVDGNTSGFCELRILAGLSYFRPTSQG